MAERADHLGHRQRLRARFLKGGAETMPDYEMLEMLLFGAQSRRDVKPLAKELLRRFGSFAEVISAEPEQLRQLDGIGEGAVTALKSVQAAAQRLLRDGVMERPVLSNWESLMDYCRASLAYEKTERFQILFLNRKNVLIADEIQQKGTVDHTPVYPREIVKRALELGATALIMVHNHPSGDPTPSEADIAMTREVRDAGEKLGIVLHDHVVVAKGGYQSFKTLGLL
ncbi:MAG: DNA repair protein RadC [Rhodospirillales bacterium]|nr:DNA repair protein RadC [Rhodospirillales bacterium]MDP6805090.1 DNA repair protein RadC [Rhodospirillales bacterium]